MNVAGIREGTGLTQVEFARLAGVSLRTLQEWEQGRRRPSGAARALLARIAEEVKAPPALTHHPWCAKSHGPAVDIVGAGGGQRSAPRFAPGR